MYPPPSRSRSRQSNLARGGQSVMGSQTARAGPSRPISRPGSRQNYSKAESPMIPVQPMGSQTARPVSRNSRPSSRPLAARKGPKELPPHARCRNAVLQLNSTHPFTLARRKPTEIGPPLGLPDTRPITPWEWPHNNIPDLTHSHQMQMADGFGATVRGGKRQFGKEQKALGHPYPLVFPNWYPGRKEEWELYPYA